MKGGFAEKFRSELETSFQADPKSFDEWKQTKLVRFLEWPGPCILPRDEVLLGRKGVVKVRDGGNVPRITGH